MINLDETNITGTVDIVLMDSTGKIKDERHIKNMVVATGKQMLAENFVGLSSKTITHIALGEGTAATTSATTALSSPIAGGSIAASLSIGGSLNSFTYTAVFAAGVATGALTEVGEFNVDGAVTTMFARTVFPVVNKQAADILAVSWTTAIN